MDKATALDFLAQHSPLPDEADLEDAVLETYGQVWRYFESNPDPACIAPILQSFGRGSGRGVYQLVLDVFESYSLEEMSPPLMDALRSPHESVRYWACQVAEDHPAPEIVPALMACLEDSCADIPLAAAAALESASAKEALPAIREAMRRSNDSDEKEDFEGIVKVLEES